MTFSAVPRLRWCQLASALLLTAVAIAPLAAAPVINEIHYNNDENIVANEFVELFNPGEDDLNLAGWRLTGGIEYTFPSPTILRTREYLVVAEDPATILAQFGMAALGPYFGGLSGKGEEIDLVDAGGTRVDRVDYGVDFPWPTAADGSGSSMELINPALDNNLGSSWRSATGNIPPPPPPPQDPPAENSLIAHYDFESDFSNKVPGGAPGTGFNGAAAGQAGGISGKAMTLAGGNNGAGNSDFMRSAINYGGTASLSDAGTNFTIALWYKLDNPWLASNEGTSGRLFVFEGNTDYDVSYSVRGNGVGQTYTKDGGNTTIANAGLAGVWHSVVTTYASSGGTTRVTTWIDGTKHPATLTPSTANFVGTTGINFGVHRAEDRAFDGQIDEIKIWNTVLSDAQILASYGSVVETTYLSPANSNWHYRKGQSNNPPLDGAGNSWTDLGYDTSADNVTWFSGAQTPLGYGDDDDNTVLGDMDGNYSTVYLRNTFLIPDLTPDNDVPSQLTLRLYIDDGCIAYLNGNEVAREFTSDGVKNFNSTTGENSHESSWITLTVNAAQAGLVEGVNSIAIHALNATIGSSDFSIDAEVKTPDPSDVEGVPTPGTQNSTWSPNAPPNIRQVDHTPQQPNDSQPVVITAKVTDPDGVASVELQYQLVAPGAYVPAFLAKTTSALLADPTSSRQPNPTYQQGWFSIAMTDDGSGGDALAGDKVYTAMIAAQPHRTLVRYRIRISDLSGEAITVPYPDDDALNFAYFSYNGIPDFVAGTRSVTGTVPTVHSAATLTTLPGYHLLTTQADYDQCIAYSSSNQIPQSNFDAREEFNWSGTFVYNGIVYDNMRYRLRQRNFRYSGSGKRSFRFRFNRGHYAQFHDVWGDPYPTKWRTMNTHKNNTRDGNNFGLFEIANAILWKLTGTPAPSTHWIHLRIIKGAEEAPTGANGQHYGDFWGLLLALEDYDSRFLEANDLEDGNLYKLKPNRTDGLDVIRYQAKDSVSDGSDFENIIFNLRPARTDPWLREHVDWESWYIYHAIVDAVRHYDVLLDNGHLKNRAYYFKPDPGTSLGKLHVLPWDSDTSWGPNWYGGVDFTKQAMGSRPVFNLEYRNVVREVRDLIWQRDQIYGLLDLLDDKISPFQLADRDRWTGAPTADGYQTDGPVANRLQSMKNFAFLGGSWTGGNNSNMAAISRDNNISGARGRDAYLDALIADSAIPDTPTLTDLSDPNHSANTLRFQSSAFSDSTGSFAAMEYRIAEVASYAGDGLPFPFEWAATWESGELTTFTAEIVPPASAVRGDRTYRARVRHQDTTGRWSHWSAPVSFTASYPEILIYQESLVISEIMYNPAGSDDTEYIELKNIGPLTLNLTNVRFTKGIDFDFPQNTELLPGDSLLVVKNVTAFEAVYGAGLPIAGEYQFEDESSLSNEGERIKLAFGALAIHDFEFDDQAPWPDAADGGGYSLVLAHTSSNAAADPLDPLGHGIASNWRTSAFPAGTPGSSNSQSFTGADPAADDDQDGLSAFLEHALGSADHDPNQGPGLFSAGVDEDSLTFSFRRNLLADDVAYGIEISSDLVNWTDAVGRLVETPMGDGTSTVTFISDAPLSGSSRLFMRLRVQQVTALP